MKEKKPLNVSAGNLLFSFGVGLSLFPLISSLPVHGQDDTNIILLVSNSEHQTP